MEELKILIKKLETMVPQSGNYKEYMYLVMRADKLLKQIENDSN